MALRQRRMMTVATAFLLGAALAGCASGSGVATGSGFGNNMMFDTLSGAGLIPKQREDIDYSPRTGLVMPASANTLPTPQEQRVVTNPDWPQDARNPASEGELAGLTPREARRTIFARIAGAGVSPAKGDRSFVNDRNASIDATERFGRQMKVARKRIDERRGKALDTSGSPTRRYLTDPPLTYRAPVETTTVDGEIVTRQAAVAPPEQKRGLRRFLPF